MKVRIKKLVPNAVIPSASKLGDAGLDLTAIGMKHVSEFVEYQTGLAIEIPIGYVGLIFPRSSISKYSLCLANCVGVIDAGYRGEILCRFKETLPISGEIYKIGDRIAQLIIMPFPMIDLQEVDELSSSERGDGGFGSSNK